MSGSLTSAPAPPSTASPAATRARRSTWRDPRLAVGLLLVCVSVLVGARVLAGADDTVPVLAARGPLAAGERLDADDLVPVQLRFSTESDADRYLPGDSAGLEGAVLLRPVGAGELVPRAAVSADGDAPLVELPLPVEPSRVPASVGAGSVVDVWVTAAEGQPAGRQGGRRAVQLLSEVPVLSASRPAAVGPSGLRQVVVGVPAGEEPELAEVVGRLRDGASLLVLRRPG